METNENLLTGELHVDAIGYSHLKETVQWSKFLAIVGFVISVLIVVVGLFAGTLLSTFSGAGAVVSTAVLGVVYAILGAIYFVLSLFLFRFATRMNVALQSADQDSFNLSLHNQKLVYRIMGIIVVIYLALIVLGVIFGIGAAAFMS